VALNTPMACFGESEKMENSGLSARVYRITWWWRAGAVFFLTIGSVVSIGIWNGIIFGEREPKFAEMVGTPVLAIVGVFLAWSAFRATVTLSADAIELRTLFERKRLPLNAIRGRREYVVRGGTVDVGGSTRYLKLEPNDDRLPTMDIVKYFNFDDRFYQWFKALPDLDALDKQRREALEKDPHNNSNFGLV
jgi:hypothetical protein